MTVIRMTMPRGRARPALLALAALTLAGCGYKPLKAPCAPDEGGTPLAYAEQSRPAAVEPFASLARCGRMKPI